MWLSTAGPSQRESLIEWNASKRLDWNDFKAKPDRNSPNAALTSTTIKFDFTYNDQGLTLHIHCAFDRNLSWGRVRNDYILSHEQGHFDIAEIFARELFKKLKDYQLRDVNKLSRDLNKIYENTMQELNDMQAKYDKETNFSINKEKQSEWLVKISKELERLQPYADYH
jgi:Bacterial protein of unknown function (DUF922)